MIGRNTVLNAVGVAVPLAIGAFLVPILTAHLGPARFGLLSLAWALLEYSALFDVGLGRATTRFVAASLARGGEGVSEVVATSLAAQLALGLVGAGALALAAPALGRMIGARGGLVAEATASFYVLALSVPLVLLGGSLRGLLEAAQRFDLSTAIRIPSSTATFAVSAVAAAYGATLPRILFYLFLTRLANAAALMWASRVAIPSLRWQRPRDRTQLRPLLSFGGWVAVSSVISPILLYLDRFVLGAAAGLAAVGYYAAPYEGVSRLLILPASFVTVLFPAVTAIDARGDRAELLRVLGTSARTVVLLLVPAVCVLVAFAAPVLHLWLGPVYAERSAAALRILAVGVLCNAAAYVPFVYVQALGRPDVTGKLHLAELAVHVPLTWFLVRHFGATGAAMAWTTRVALDALLVATAALRVTGLPASHLASARARWLLASGLALVATLAGAASLLARQPAPAVALAFLALLTFAAVAWARVLGDDERRALFAVLRPRRGAAAPAA